MWNYGGIIMEQNNGILMEFQLRIYPVKYRQHGNLTFSITWKFDEIFYNCFSITWNWIIPLQGIRSLHEMA